MPTRTRRHGAARLGDLVVAAWLQEVRAMWARLDDAILDNPKIIAAGPLGFALHVAAITWCSRNLTDGFIPKRRVSQLLDLSSLQVSETTLGRVRHRVTCEDLAADLARIGLWHDHGVSWEVHDYLVYNLRRAEVLARRERAREKKRRQRGDVVPPDVPRDVPPDVPPDVPRGQTRDTRGTSHHPVPVPVPVPGSQEDTLSFASLTQGAEPAPRATELGFDRFWLTYPKKRHKPAALRAWKVTDGARHLEAILVSVERWKESDAWRRGFVEDAATFLRQRQWEDTPAAAPLTGGTTKTAGNLEAIKAGLELLR